MVMRRTLRGQKLDVTSKLGHNLVPTWSLIGLRQNMAILWTFIGQNMDFGQKLAKTWETLIRHQHPFLYSFAGSLCAANGNRALTWNVNVMHRRQ